MRRARPSTAGSPGGPDALVRADATASPEQQVVAGRYRVTVLEPRLLRVEYAEDAAFEDRPTLAVVNRRFPPARFAARTEGRGVVVDTGSVVLTVADVDAAPTGRTLTARVAVPGGRPARWRYGQASRRNLGATVRTLDDWNGRCTARLVGFDPVEGFLREWEEQDLGEGLLSRDGWVVVDDSGTVVLDPDAGGSAAGGRPWPVARPAGERVDLYLFGFGTDHRAALAAGSRLLGPQPLPPRYAFGYWYSRYFPYTDGELLELADRLDEHGIPTDVLVVDMDWHRLGWTGYSWDRDLFPDPTATLAELHRRGLRVGLNLHPADGVAPHEDAFAAVCEAMGLDPAATDRVPFDPTDPRFVDAYLRLLHHPEEDRGVDLWWLDWQQGTESALPGLDPLGWLNHLHWDDQVRRRPRRRPLLFSRWDGLGAGRRPVGFSGDTWATWESLAFQPEMTATAANVLYGYWSHDIGGHYQGAYDPELFVRWVQFGVHSPVLRTHGTLGLVEERRVWQYPDPYRTAMIDAIRHRYEMVPYLYGECRRGVDSGLSLVRPMYHEHPDQPDAYRAPGQYHLGADLVVAPVVTPRDDDAMAEVRVWLPPGEWFDTAHGARIAADGGRGRWVRRRYLLDEVPVFARAGAVVPGQGRVDRLDAACWPSLVLTAHPGGDGHHDLYEDDGESTDYLDGGSVTVPVDHVERAASRRVVLGPAVGGYRGWRRRRDVEVRFVGEAPPRAVRVDDRVVPHADRPTPGHWHLDASTASVVVPVADVDLAEGTTVTVERSRRRDRAEVQRLLDGLPGLLRRLAVISTETRVLLADDSRRVVAVLRAAERVGTDPEGAAAELGRVRGAGGEIAAALRRAEAAWREGEALNPQRPPAATDTLAAMGRLLATARRQFPRP
ncbi:MAG: DUF5110 domain-containing protein [Acidimicrobiales bacterium]|nr:DUF5110 domain-containing protein [Acidimicrobiales bacterium]